MKSDFAGDPRIVGRTIRISQQPFVVLGVARPDFTGSERFIRADLWTDLWNEQQIEGYSFINNRRNQNIWVMGRRLPGVTAGQAQADLNRIAQALAREYPADEANTTFRVAPMGFIGDAFGGPLRSFLTALMFLAALVLLAACVNLGGLYVARASDRTRELAIRAALGATRARITLQLIVESLAVSVIGGSLGFLLARATLHALTLYRPPFDFPVAVTVEPSGRLIFVLNEAVRIAERKQAE